MLMTRWLRWLVVTPVLLFVFGAILLSCTSGGGSSATATPSPGFRLQSLAISEGPPPSPTATPPIGPTPKKKTPTPTLTPRPEATSTSVTTSPVQFDAIGTFTKKKKTEFVDLTIAPLTLWTSRDPGTLIPPNPGADGGNYTIGTAGCTCIQASNSGVSSQTVAVGVLVDVATCTAVPCPTPIATITPTPVVRGAPNAASTAAAASAADSAGVLMWSFDAGAELRGRIATGVDGSIYFITRDGVLHGLDSSGKAIMYRQADGLAPAVLANGTVIAMSSASHLAAINPDGIVRWQLEIGAASGPVAATDSTIYVSAGSELLSVSSVGALNWRVGVDK